MLVPLPDPNPESAAGRPSDRELLRRFETGHDEAAFAAVLRRHGPMVLRVCRRILDRPEDAEDAFQATFLVLARKAGAVEWRESVGTWLHAAARRLASEVRRKRVRRQMREARRPAPPPGATLDEVSSRELLTILDEEMAALPEECRGPLVLCCLEGMTGDEASEQLGCSPSTLKRRLRDGRELLRARLARRGVALSAAALATLLAAGTAAADVPVALAAGTTRAAVQFGAGAAVAPGLVSPAAVGLARGVLPATGAKVVAAIAVGFAVAVFVAGWAVGWFGNPVGREIPALGGGVAPPPRAAAPVVAVAPAPRAAVPKVRATVETSLRTVGGQIRQFAFDNDPATFFASFANPGADDHFTLVFERPVAVRSVGVRTGGFGDLVLEGGRLEVSADGAEFEKFAAFANGAARADAGGRLLRAVRIRPAAQKHPLTVREFTIDSDPPVAAFRHPVEFAVDATDAKDLAGWAEESARICERAYPMICDELASDGFRPPTFIPLVVRRDAKAPTAAAGGRVVASAEYFRDNPNDVGALVHAASYVVQKARGPAPAWLVSGIADYVRFFKFEPGVIDPPDPDAARHDGDSRETAAFLAYLAAEYDPGVVRRVNAALRDGRYTEDLWHKLTGKPLRELGDEWRRSLRP